VVEIERDADEGMRLPGSGSPEPLLVNLTVRIASTTRADFDFNKAPKESYVEFPIHVGPAIPGLTQ
jgi:hypothetical protein